MRRGITGGTGRRTPVSQTISKPKALGPEHNPWFWNPYNVSAVRAPKAFMEKIRSVDPEGTLDVIWNPIRERWGVFMKSRAINHPICRGWKLLFLVELNGEYIPLDERVLAVLYERSGRRYGNLWEYWIKVEQALDRDRERVEATNRQATMDAAGDYYDFMKVKNYGSGSKYSQYHQ